MAQANGRMTGKVATAYAKTSVTELAYRTGTTPSFISMLFRGKREARVDTLRRIAGALGVSVDELDTYLVSIKGQSGKMSRHGWPKPSPRSCSKAPAAA